MSPLDPPRGLVDSSPEGLAVARVLRIERGHAEVWLDGDARLLPVSKKQLRACQPVTGDWAHVDVARGVVTGLAPRATCLRRRAPAARGGDQAVVANFDVALIVMGLDGDFSIRRAERYAALVATSGADAVVLLTKAASVTLAKEAVAAVADAVGDAPVHAIDVVAGVGLEVARRALGRRVGVVIGSSGAGKSTLTNHLLGEAHQPTREVRARDSRGRHTTVRRELFLLPGGGAIIDTPGLREVGLADDADLDDAFADLAGLAAGCRFGDCRHESEPGCAVRVAVDEGALAESRVEAWRRLREERATSQRRGR
ncbi:MAG: ribosome small subunit-dependent GTPase A [Polyangiaceae bacterium]|nr:ribosome small subunit-dependent GTPase A [Polyangiaceae bacterium]